MSGIRCLIGPFLLLPRTASQRKPAPKPSNETTITNGTRIRSDSVTSNIGQRIDAGMMTLAEVCDRLAFVRPPFDLANIAAVADEFFLESAGLIVLDYIQRIQPPGEHGDKRGSVDATMNHLRAFADAGVAVVVLSAVGRTKDKQGRSSYSGEGLSLASLARRQHR